MNIEVRAKKIIIEGYVNAVGRDSRVLEDENGKFVEQIVPGTFQRALANGTEIFLLQDHSEKRKLGSSLSNLTLCEDIIGLYARAEVTDAEIIRLAKEKKLRGWSFGYLPLGYLPSETTSAGIERRMVNDMELLEVSIISSMIPAYQGTSIKNRAEIEGREIQLRSFYTGTEYKEIKETDPSVRTLKNEIKILKEIKDGK